MVDEDILSSVGSEDRLIDERMRLYECDLLTLKDGCRLDTQTLRGFCVERDGYFRLAPVTIGTEAVINAYTNISPGANIADGAVYGPHASSYESPSENSYAAYNGTLLPDPSLPLRIFIAWPIILIVTFLSCKCVLHYSFHSLIPFSDIPWVFMIYAMSGHRSQFKRDTLNDFEAVIRWFASPNRLMYYIFSAIIRALIIPLIRLGLGIMIKRLLGFNVESKSWNSSQTVLLRRYINSMILSQEALNDAFKILGTHYEVVSVSLCIPSPRFRLRTILAIFRLLTGQWVLKSVEVSTGPARALFVRTLSCWILAIMPFLDFSLV